MELVGTPLIKSMKYTQIVQKYIYTISRHWANKIKVQKFSTMYKHYQIILKLISLIRYISHI